MAVAGSQDPCLTVAPPQAAPISHQPQASESCADMMDDGSPEMPPIFEDLLEGEWGGEEAEGDANYDRLDMEEMEEDDSTFPVQQSKALQRIGSCYSSRQ